MAAMLMSATEFIIRFSKTTLEVMWGSAKFVVFVLSDRPGSFVEHNCGRTASNKAEQLYFKTARLAFLYLLDLESIQYD